MPTAVLITNPKSGARLDGALRGRPELDTLEEAGIHVTPLKGSIAKQVAQSLAHPADIVIVDGGDGTINAVLGAHERDSRPIGILPGGTMNLLATDYGVPHDRVEAARVIAAGHTRAVDGATIGGRLFLHTALTGLPARIGVHREDRRGKLGVRQKAALAVHAFATRHKDPMLDLEITRSDGAHEGLHASTFAILVGSVSGSLLPRPNRDVAAGELTAFAIDPDDGAALALLVMKGAFGLSHDEALRRCLIERARLSGQRRKVHAMVDGESVLVSLPAQIAVRPKIANILSLREEAP
ncbi:MAG: diacylglycerol kinase family protein [Pseudomonadota bacterium]